MPTPVFFSTPAAFRLAAFGHRRADKSAIYSHEQSTAAELPPQQLSEFQRHQRAWQFFDAAPPGCRTVMLHWVASAKRAETRAAWFAQRLAACKAGERVDLWVKKGKA